MPTSDDIGNRGQAVCVEHLTRLIGPKLVPLFRPWFLGDKFATFDFLVELVGLSGRAAYCFIQVKSTTLGYTHHTPARLRVGVSEQDAFRMLVNPAPTYVVGVDAIKDKAFLASIDRRHPGGIPSLTTRFPLNVKNLQTLWHEVEVFWGRRDMTSDSAFSI